MERTDDDASGDSVVPPGVLSRVGASLLGARVDLHAATYGEQGAVHLRLRPRRWPTENEGCVRIAQERVVEDLARTLPLLDVAPHTCALDQQPEIGVRLPGAVERRRAAAVRAARHPIARLMGALSTLLLLAAVAMLISELSGSFEVTPQAAGKAPASAEQPPSS